MSIRIERVWKPTPTRINMILLVGLGIGVIAIIPAVFSGFLPGQTALYLMALLLGLTMLVMAFALAQIALFIYAASR